MVEDSEKLADLKAFARSVLRGGQVAKHQNHVHVSEMVGACVEGEEVLHTWGVGTPHAVYGDRVLMNGHLLIAAGPAYIGPPLPKGDHE